jgi:hypothetical protein
MRDGSPADAVVEELLLVRKDVRMQVQITGHQDQCFFADVDVYLSLEVGLVGVEASRAKGAGGRGIQSLKAGDGTVNNAF